MQSPDHYQDTRLMDLLVEKRVPFAEGNIMKYVYRWKEKDGLKDLRKAADYLHALIAHEELKQMGYVGDRVYSDPQQVSKTEDN
jgi:hypothetical protein